MSNTLFPVVQPPQIQSEKLLPLCLAVYEATGTKPALSTVLRWVNRPGICLESRILGGRRLTSTEAVLRFMEATTNARDGKRVPKSQSEDVA